MDFDDASSSSSSSSSDSDDEFLTSAGGGQSNALSREALVRKKLLESFYGASAATVDDETAEEDPNDSSAAVTNNNNGEEDDDGNIVEEQGDNTGDHNNNMLSSATSDIPTSITHPSSSSSSNAPFRSPSQIPLPFTATKTDLDSPNFNPESHTLSHIAHSSAHTLLETNERLALDIRTLDSTMQTLVYENYSKFIDATDAIKSIGTNVTTAGESGLDRLNLGMERIAHASARSDQLLRASREAVAEKLRIQRLLTRLDALLCLPKTLRCDIAEKRHRKAVKSYKSATEILGRHSAGFESLRSIEAECGEILQELAEDLKKKLLWWGQQADSSSVGMSALSQSAVPPSSIAEIFECAGTLLMLQDTAFSPGLDRRQCQSLALSACTQFLKERLDPPGTPMNSPPTSPSRRTEELDATENNDEDVNGIISELPLAFLDGLLEATTLYGVSFPIMGDDDDSPSNHGSELIGSFVENNFGSFIEHVRVLLIRRSESFSQPTIEESKSQEEEERKDDANFVQVTFALAHLLRSVRELASGLALPEVGMDLSIASSLVDQTVELAETMVRLRIAVKFTELRGLVLKECLSPLVREVIQADKQPDDQKEEEDNSRPSSSLVEMIQLSSVALSDGLQMADDLIRATLQQSQATNTAAPVDSAVVKLAVQKNARLFGIWLACTLEQLAGCEPSGDDKVLLEIDEEKNEDAKHKKKIDIAGIERDDELSGQNKDGMVVLSSLLVQLDTCSDESYSNFLLALCEMCRLAERSISTTLNQSIQSAMEEDARVAESANTLFGGTINPHRKGKDGLDVEHILSKRFQLAASRALSMYILDRGSHAASHLCTGMLQFADARDPYAIPTRPREEVLKLFDIVKASCEDAISIMGGDLFASAVSPFPDEIDYANAFGERLSGGNVGGTTSGLKMDVERMFIENIQVYPHTFDELEFNRNSVISGILRVGLSGLVECVRSSVFSSLGLRQMKVDAVLLRYLLPHYVKDVYGTPDANAFTSVCNAIDNVMLNAEQRCVDPEVIGDDEYYDAEKDEIVTPFLLVQHFLFSNDGDENVMERISFS